MPAAEVLLQPVGLYLDLLECQLQYDGAAKPQRELFAEDLPI